MSALTLSRSSRASRSRRASVSRKLSGAAGMACEVLEARQMLTAAPVAPTNLTATAVSGHEVDLAWTDNNAAGVEDNQTIERSADGGATWTAFTGVAAGVTSYHDTGRYPGAYEYRIQATRYDWPSDPQEVDSGWSDAASATVAFNAPTNLTATETGDGFDLAWQVHSDNETSVVVEWSTDGGASWSGQTLAPGTQTYHRTGEYPGGYQFRVHEEVYDYDRSQTDTTAFSTTSDTVNFAAPTGLVAGASTTSNSDEIDMTWTNNTDKGDALIERSSNDGQSWTPIKTITAVDGPMSYHDESLNPGTYLYCVCDEVYNNDTHVEDYTGFSTLAAPQSTRRISVSRDMIWTQGAANTPLSGHVNLSGKDVPVQDQPTVHVSIPANEQGFFVFDDGTANGATSLDLPTDGNAVFTITIKGLQTTALGAKHFTIHTDGADDVTISVNITM